eukprot:scaffold1793_cov164-Ochromonas_danica.AAC.4
MGASLLGVAGGEVNLFVAESGMRSGIPWSGCIVLVFHVPFCEAKAGSTVQQSACACFVPPSHHCDKKRTERG